MKLESNSHSSHFLEHRGVSERPVQWESLALCVGKI